MRGRTWVGIVVTGLVVAGLLIAYVEKRAREAHARHPDTIERQRIVREYVELHHDGRDRGLLAGAAYYAELLSAGEAEADRRIGDRGRRKR